MTDLQIGDRVIIGKASYCADVEPGTEATVEDTSGLDGENVILVSSGEAHWYLDPDMLTKKESE